jgi:putative acetyltransferase
VRARIREEAAGDREAIQEVHRLAFAGSAEALLVDKLRAVGAASIALIAERETQIVGHILFSVLEAPMRALSLAPVGVHPRFQGLGIGSALIRRGLDVAAARSWEAVFVLGDPCFYERFGFSVEAARHFSSPYAGEHFMVRALAGREIPSTGELGYAAPFGELG